MEKVYYKEDIKKSIGITSDKQFYKLLKRRIIPLSRDNRTPSQWTEEQMQQIEANRKKQFAGEWKNE